MADFIYRTLTSDHAQAWQDLRVEGARDYPMGFLVTLEETMAISVDRCRAILDGETIRGVFADEKLIGFCGYRPERLTRIRHRGEIGPFFVTRDYQGTGAAKTLMRGVVEEAKGNGLAQLELFVDTENLRAIAFYEGQGFARAATHRDSVRIEGQSRDDHLYILRLKR